MLSSAAQSKMPVAGNRVLHKACVALADWMTATVHLNKLLNMGCSCGQLSIDQAGLCIGKVGLQPSCT